MVNVSVENSSAKRTWPQVNINALASLPTTRTSQPREERVNTAGRSKELCLTIYAASKSNIEQCKAELERRQQDAIQTSAQRKKPTGAAEKYIPKLSKVSLQLKV